MKCNQFYGQQTAIWYLATLHKSLKRGWPIGHFESYGIDLDQEDLDAGTLIFEYGYGVAAPKSLLLEVGNAGYLRSLFKSYITALQKALFNEEEPSVSVTEKKPKGYVGVKGEGYDGIVVITDIKEIAGLYGKADLIAFRDKDDNIIKVFAKVGVGKLLKINEKAHLQGLVAKQHVYAGEKETILRHASISQDGHIDLPQFSNEVDAIATIAASNAAKPPTDAIEQI